MPKSVTQGDTMQPRLHQQTTRRFDVTPPRIGQNMIRAAMHSGMRCNTSWEGLKARSHGTGRRPPRQLPPWRGRSGRRLRLSTPDLRRQTTWSECLFVVSLAVQPPSAGRSLGHCWCRHRVNASLWCAHLQLRHPCRRRSAGQGLEVGEDIHTQASHCRAHEMGNYTPGCIATNVKPSDLRLCASCAVTAQNMP